VSAEHAISRVMHTTRTRNTPIALLDPKGAYPSVPRKIDLMREHVDPELADVLTIMLAPTRVIAIGDPHATVDYTHRGLT
jgi:hypothetical protein